MLPEVGALASVGPLLWEIIDARFFHEKTLLIQTVACILIPMILGACAIHAAVLSRHDT